MTRSITTWNRLEPRPEGLDPTLGLEARVYDPAWLLGRQWQLGELTGEDAASPALIRIHAATSRLTRYRPTADPAAKPIRLSPDKLLEPVVEAETEEPADWRSAAESGAHFLTLLASMRPPPPAQLRDALVKAFVKEYTLPDPASLAPPLNPTEARALRLFRRHSLDGTRLRRAVRAAAKAAGQPVALPPKPQVDPTLADAVLEVLGRWLAWYPRPAAQSSWQPERMEYRFAIAAPNPSGTGELVLEAPEYAVGRLDWHDLRVSSGQRLGAASDGAPKRHMHTLLPTPVTYPGMPANRWWQFEDARVWFGGAETEAGDLARMLLIEFATVYGNDWFIAPLELDTGTLTYVKALVVEDTFGRATLIQPTEVAAAASGPKPWRMFHASGAEPHLFLLPPVATQTLEGAPIEKVSLQRDETANMAWAIERNVTGRLGNVIDRHEQWRARRGAEPEPELAQERMSYRLATEVPDHWIPLVPRSDGLRSIRLDRGSIPDAHGHTHPPLGRLLEPSRPLSLFEEEVPRSGFVITRAWQISRTADGTTIAWIGRAKRPGGGEVASGLNYDQLTPPSPPQD